MFERCLSEAERVLASSTQVTLPVKELWNQVRTRCKAISTESPTLADFSAMLDADPRFEFLQTSSEEPEPQVELFEDEGEMGSLGVRPEDLVKLRRVKMVRDPGEDDESPSTRVKGLGTTATVNAMPSTRPKKPVKKSKPQKRVAAKRTPPARKKKAASARKTPKKKR